jgi:hypothetical protein
MHLSVHDLLMIDDSRKTASTYLIGAGLLSSVLGFLLSGSGMMIG